jgi:flagellar export protein FliJ
VAGKIVAAQRDVHVARASLAEAAKHRMVLDKVREKQQARWREELDRKELAQLDEVGMQMSVQRMLDQAERPSDEVTP